MKFFYDKIRRFFILIRYLSLKRIYNSICLWFSYLTSLVGLQTIGKSVPFFLSIEVTNYCNLLCPECPVGVRRNTMPARVLFDLTLYKKIIDNQKNTLLHVILYFQGEPFLNILLPEFVKYAHQARIYTSTSTNGQLLNKKNAKEIVLSGLDKIIVSIDGSTQEIYETYRVGGKLQKALDGIKELVYWKRELNSPTPLIEMQFLVLRTNEHQLDAMKRLAKSLQVDKLTFKTAQLYDFENGHPLLTTIKRYSRYIKTPEGKYKIKNKLSNHCQRLWYGAVINASGEVLPCCFDKQSEFSFGNITDTSLGECLHGKKASDFREQILQNRKQIAMCRNCTSR